MERVRPTERALPAITAALAVAALLAAAASAFRLRAAEALGFGLTIAGPRLLLTATVGAGLAASALLARRRGRDLLQRELWLFGASAGGGFGGALWTARFGPAAAVLGSLLGAALLAAALHGLRRLPRAWLFLFGLAYAGSCYLCVYGSTYARGSLDAARARLAWWGGDFSYATWPGACAFAAAVLLLLSVAAASAAAGRAGTRATLDMLLLGLAVGAGGPIAFVGISGAGLATFAAKQLGAGRQLALAALIGAGGLTLADALQRKLLGGYAFAPGSLTSFVAFPFVYFACVRAKQHSEGRSRRWLGAVEAVGVLAIVTLGYLFVAFIAVLIDGFA